jgi:hypothetical protein
MRACIRSEPHDCSTHLSSFIRYRLPHDARSDAKENYVRHAEMQGLTNGKFVDEMSDAVFDVRLNDASQV